MRHCSDPQAGTDLLRGQTGVPDDSPTARMAGRPAVRRGPGGPGRRRARRAAERLCGVPGHRRRRQASRRRLDGGAGGAADDGPGDICAPGPAAGGCRASVRCGVELVAHRALGPLRRGPSRGLLRGVRHRHPLRAPAGGVRPGCAGRGHCLPRRFRPAAGQSIGRGGHGAAGARVLRARAAAPVP